MFISTAWAQGAGAAGGSGLIQAVIPLVLIFGVFYFLLIRPQQKKVKQHREMLNNIRRGDRVVTGGGIFGTVTNLLARLRARHLFHGQRFGGRRRVLHACAHGGDTAGARKCACARLDTHPTWPLVR